MTQKKPTFVSLGDLALELGIKRSQLLYYKTRGLLIPISTISKTNLFDKVETIKAINKIQKLKEQNKTLAEIKELL